MWCFQKCGHLHMDKFSETVHKRLIVGIDERAKKCFNLPNKTDTHGLPTLLFDSYSYSSMKVHGGI